MAEPMEIETSSPLAVDFTLGKASPDKHGISASLSELLDAPRDVRRSGRKREDKSYAECPDIVIEEDFLSGPAAKKPALLAGPQANMTISVSNGIEMESDSEEDDVLPHIPYPKEISSEELKEKQALIKRLKTELKNEEMSLVLLKKLKQSQNPCATNLGSGATISTGATLTPTGKIPIEKQQIQKSLYTKQNSMVDHLTSDKMNLLPSKSVHGSMNHNAATNLLNLHGYDSKRSLTIDKSDAVQSKPPKPEDTQTQQQRQAAAKLALRKQLEKTLLQIPPPKPPPPEMHFIPNPANTEFIYLTGLEECVNRILNLDAVTLPQPCPFTCSQCRTDFTPTWKWDKAAKEVRVICEQCVTSNVKKALKAEHTNRLKAAFVKALQQEQELEAKIASLPEGASLDGPTTPKPKSGSSVDVIVSRSRSPSVTPRTTQAQTHTQTYRHTDTSRQNNRTSHTTSQSSKRQDTGYSSYNNSRGPSSQKSSNNSLGLPSQLASSLQGFDLASLAALQAAATAQQHLIYGNGTSGSGSSRNSNSTSTTSANTAAANSMSQLAAMSQAMMNPMMYPYQALAMAQLMGVTQGSTPSSTGGNNSSAGKNNQSAASQMLEIQRQAAEQLQRQYLLDMIPGTLSQSWAKK